MNITGSPVSTSFQVKDWVSEAPGQQAAAGTKGASDWSASVDKQKTQASSEGNTAGESLDEINTRTKRGVKGIGSKIYSFVSPKPPKTNLIAHAYKPTSTLGPTRPVGPSNSQGVTKFREMVFKTQHPNSSLTGPAKPAVAKPQTFGDVAANLVSADRLVKAGVFKTDTSLKTVTRDAFVSASVNGLVSTPLSIGTYAGSVWTDETIKGNFTASTPLLPPAHQPAPSQAANAASAAGSGGAEQSAALVKTRTESAELKMLYAVNTIQAMVEGGDGKALEKSSTWPVDINERLDLMEKIYDASEKNMAEVSEQNGFIYKPYKDDSTVGSKSVTARLDALDKRYEHLNSNGIGRLLAVREVETKKTQTV
ncbi:hypothetical protein [Pseudomonas proteolytica]|uniref:hypothetical protein n=1 Tax=Pseudomonas proteolytica TaxID=219574 RepID=UPI001475D129|nr:hypothetical protein [Pseudomonas proteolytica]NMZ40542.1 hypothetical protein [Pseudomonas proteolytica]